MLWLVIFFFLHVIFTLWSVKSWPPCLYAWPCKPSEACVLAAALFRASTQCTEVPDAGVLLLDRGLVRQLIWGWPAGSNANMQGHHGHIQGHFLFLPVSLLGNQAEPSIILCSWCQLVQSSRILIKPHQPLKSSYQHPKCNLGTVLESWKLWQCYPE